MRNKAKFIIITILLVIVGMIFIVLFVGHDGSKKSFYIDSLIGNDSNSGQSPNSPWKTLQKVNATTFSPGSIILFKAGGSWSGSLKPMGSGLEGKPIIIDSYGKGNKPILNGNGAFNGTIELNNQQHWEIRNLEITNQHTFEGKLSGIRVFAADIGAVEHIYITNCTIHHVTGKLDSKSTAGISIEAGGNSIPTWFNDLRIEGNTIYNVNRQGITTNSVWKYRPEISETPNWKPFTNVVVKNNYLYDIGGDGILLLNCDKALIEYNVVHDAAARNKDYNVGIWSFNSDNSLFQYNEAYLTRTDKDGEGFDIDYLQKGTIFQYNYSHDNEGGFMLICNDGSQKGCFTSDSIIRYNISQNDQDNVFNFSGPTNNTKIYNNTIYISQNLSTQVFKHSDWSGYARDVYSYNNIFYNLGKGGYVFAKSQNNVFENNLFYGQHPESEPEDLYKITEDPLFVSPGSGGDGIETLAGYKLLKGSPAYKAGKIISNNGGKDYFGNEVSDKNPPSIGAYNGKPIEMQADIKAPSTPSELKFVSKTNQSITIQWSQCEDNVGVTGYQVFANGIVAATAYGNSSGSTVITIPQLAGSKEYTIEVRAYDYASNLSDASNTIVIKTEDDSNYINAIKNGDFELGKLDYWDISSNVTLNTEESIIGKYCVKVENTEGIFQKVTGLLPNTDYAFKVSAKKIGEGWACVGVKDYGGEDRQKIIENNEYNEFTINVKTGETNTSASIYLWSDGTGTFYADDFQLIGKIAPTANKLIPLLNSGFEDGDLNSWTVLGNSVVETSDTTTGKFSLKVTDDQGLERLVEGLTPNTIYDVSVIAKVRKGGWASLGVRDYGDSEIYTPIVASEYSEIKLSFMTGKDSTSALIYFWNDGEETAYFDDFKMMTYVPEN